MSTIEGALAYLKKPRPLFIDIFVSIHKDFTGNILIENSHFDRNGKKINEFITTWNDIKRINTEYGWGLSVVHDIKDHSFYGLGLTPLSEFQTIVQTYYGQAVSSSKDGTPINDDWELVIATAIHDELFGPRGARVYDPNAEALLDKFAPNSSQEEREEAYNHMLNICFNIILPQIQELYITNEFARLLQASTTKQPELVYSYLTNIKWADSKKLLLRIEDNIGFNIKQRAYIDQELLNMSCSIRNEIHKYSNSHNLIERFGYLFDTFNYTICDVKS